MIMREDSILNTKQCGKFMFEFEPPQGHYFVSEYIEDLTKNCKGGSCGAAIKIMAERSKSGKSGRKSDL
jgi:hypothetical protein